MRQIQGMAAGTVELAQFVQGCGEGADDARAAQVLFHHPAEFAQPILQFEPGGAQRQLSDRRAPGHERHEGEAEKTKHDIGRDQQVGTDANQDGQITKVVAAAARERLFKRLDKDGDGQITSADAAWGQLQVWRDANQDGISQAGELSGLDALGITRLGLNGSAMGPQAGQTINNNRVALSTTFTRNGVNRTVGAIDLEANAFFSEIPPQVVDEAGQPVAISETANALPQMNGSGMVRNLRAAMSLSGTQADELEVAVAAFAAAGTRDAQLALIDNLITEWAQTSSYWSSLEGYLGGPVFLSPPAGMTGEQYRNMIGVLEAFNGSRFYAQAGSAMPVGQWSSTANGVTSYALNPVAEQAQFLQQAYEALKESVYGALVMQTRLTPYLDAVELMVDASGVRFDTSGLDALALQGAQTDALNVIKDLTDLRRYGSEALQSVGWAFEDTMAAVLTSIDITPAVTALLAAEKLEWMGPQATSFAVSAAQAGFTVIGNALDNSITGNAAGSEYLYGGQGNDTLTAVGNWDVLDGGAGDDVLKLSNGAEQSTTFIGGAGNDTMTGGGYNDIYVFNRGDGSDTITDYGTHGTSSIYLDSLNFGPGITEEDLWFSRSGKDLLVQVLGDGGQVEINDWYASPNNRIEQMQLSDGQKLLAAQVDSLVNAMAAFAPPAPGQIALTPEQQTALSPVIAAGWN